MYLVNALQHLVFKGHKEAYELSDFVCAGVSQKPLHPMAEGLFSLPQQRVCLCFMVLPGLGRDSWMSGGVVLTVRGLQVWLGGRGRISWSFRVIPKLWVFLSLSLTSFLSYRSSARPRVRQAPMPHQHPRVLEPLGNNTAFS